MDKRKANKVIIFGKIGDTEIAETHVNDDEKKLIDLIGKRVQELMGASEPLPEGSGQRIPGGLKYLKGERDVICVIEPQTFQDEVLNAKGDSK